MTLTQLKHQLTKLNSLKFIYIILALIGILLIYIYLRPKSYEITHTYPADLTPNVNLDSPITFYFNQPLPSNQSIKVELNPPTLGQISYDLDRTQAVFEPQNSYSPETTYQVTASGPQVKEYTLSFTTKSRTGFPILEVPNIDNSPQVNNRNNLLATIPYRTEQFTIEYLPPSNSLIITIKAEPIDQSRQAALDYIALFGINNPEKIFNLSIDQTRDLMPNPNVQLPTIAITPQPTPTLIEIPPNDQQT